MRILLTGATVFFGSAIVRETRARPVAEAEHSEIPSWNIVFHRVQIDP